MLAFKGRFGALAVLAILSACQEAEDSQPGTPVEKSADVAAAPPRAKPTMAIHALTIIPNSNIQFAAEANLPVSSAGWKKASDAALKTAAGARELVNASDKVDDPRWDQFALAVAKHAEAAALVSETENPDDLMMADGDMLDSCNGCHAAFRD